ncbi:MAG: alkyl hydroperoxide reductase/Thiol specific antioxidant/Mal allergen [Planctomycetaceae bacterium]|nr:alkyl hydroperoxide reductase/Thiol specific antioxidant/Mal allergen [Planctomycetaceae bacterium]
MLMLRDPAPSFDCRAVVDHEIVELNWNQVHARRTLVLRFDSIENETPFSDDLLALSNSVGDFERLDANVAVVCRDHVFEILEWSNRSIDEGGAGEIAFPIIVDSDDRIASMYDMLNADGCSLWGHIIIDPDGRVRQIAMSYLHVGLNVEELIRCVAAISNEQSECE